MMTPDQIRFAADGMLQSLGTWLRLMGYDCAFETTLFGRKLLEQAVAENRVFLTRNKHLGEYLPHLLLERADIAQVAAEKLPRQLREVVEAFSLDSENYAFTRCLVCNIPLISADKQTVSDRVPPRSASLHESFWECPRCERVYWHGSHVTNSIERLKRWLGQQNP